jgi:hypothetical protein
LLLTSRILPLNVRRALLPSTVVPEYVQLNARDASAIASYLFCLAKLIDPDLT